jgi:hypothetical protein
MWGIEEKMMELTKVELDEVRECLELLRAVESIEYHNKNWLATWANRSPNELSKEKLSLIERVLGIVGTSARRAHT